MLALGVALIVAHFLLVRYFNKRVHDLAGVTDLHRTIYSVLVGAGSGVVIFAFTEIYNVICTLTTNWENHKFESDLENSNLIKTFVFNFFVSYLLLFYYSFVSPEIYVGDMSKKFTTLGTTFVSQVITKNLVSMSKLHLVPFLLSFLSARKFRKNWVLYRQTLKKNFVS